MKYTWAASDIRKGRRFFFHKEDITKRTIGLIECPDDVNRPFVMIADYTISQAYSADELADLLNSCGSIPVDISR